MQQFTEQFRVGIPVSELVERSAAAKAAWQQFLVDSAAASEAACEVFRAEVRRLQGDAVALPPGDVVDGEWEEVDGDHSTQEEQRNV